MERWIDSYILFVFFMVTLKMFLVVFQNDYQDIVAISVATYVGLLQCSKCSQADLPIDSLDTDH